MCPGSINMRKWGAVMSTQVALPPSPGLFPATTHIQGLGLCSTVATETGVSGASEERHKSFHLSLGLSFRKPPRVQSPRVDLELFLENGFEELVVRSLSDSLALSPCHFQPHLLIFSKDVLKTQELSASQLGWASRGPLSLRPREGRRPAEEQPVFTGHHLSVFPYQSGPCL